MSAACTGVLVSLTESAKLVSLAQKGDLIAFEKLVVMYQNRLFSHCYQLTGKPEDAQDLAQDVFVQVYKSLKSFRQDADFGTWLRRITINLWINSTRRQKVMQFSLDDPLPTREGDMVREIAASEESPLEKVEREEFNQMVQEALMELAPEYRNVLILREVEGYSYEEIAGLLDCSLGTVKSRLNRARRNLLAVVEKQNTE